ncbi:ABC transporter permease [Kineococcus sp. SYSU DK003]|uniref:ABC transporter permease n=1 Tax=Kineococcus sp. SYSU DK003 TaxID=3383124 RepID=UPI003D7D57FE
MNLTASRVPGPLLDVAVLGRRSLRHTFRSIDGLLTSIALPSIVLVAVSVVFGGAVSAGAVDGGYLTYVTPGILAMGVAFGAATTAVSVNVDVERGALDRIRSLPVLGPAALAGHVVAAVAKNVLAAALLLLVAVALGLRPAAGVLDWLGLVALVSSCTIALASLGTAFGLLVRGVEAAGSFSFVLLFAPYVSSAFVPVETLPTWLHGIAEHQPTTPVVETLRSLLAGQGAGDQAWTAAAWCLAGAVAGAVSAGALFRSRTSR